MTQLQAMKTTVSNSKTALCQTNFGSSLQGSSKEMKKSIFDIDLMGGLTNESADSEFDIDESIEDVDQDESSGSDPFDYMNVDPFVRV